MPNFVSIQFVDKYSKRLRLSASPRFLEKLLRQVTVWRKRMRSRYLLSQLDDRMLNDVGLTRCDVDRECAKHFWQH
jgi:uncharacterized protein YjiS (DUF1127 family)